MCSSPEHKRSKIMYCMIIPSLPDLPHYIQGPLWIPITILTQKKPKTHLPLINHEGILPSLLLPQPFYIPSTPAPIRVLRSPILHIGIQKLIPQPSQARIMPVPHPLCVLRHAQIRLGGFRRLLSHAESPLICSCITRCTIIQYKGTSILSREAHAKIPKKHGRTIWNKSEASA